MTGLYLHIPFCVRKCIYCDFYSLETVKGPIPDRLTAPLPDHSGFLDALEEELRRLPEGFRPTTIFVGGGTPTELSDANLQRLLGMIRAHTDLSALVEWTCETNPGTLSAVKARMLIQAGINRVSMGVQSFDPANLEFLGRIHGAGDVREGYQLLRETGFTDINMDLIYGIPGSSMTKIQADIDQLISYRPEHASCYCLTFEDDTPLMDMKRKGYVTEVDGEEEREQYQTIRTALKQAGYEQYEISNFSKPGHACRHNLLYWGDGEYIGCGPSAHSHWRGRRYANVRSLRRYTRALMQGASARDFEEELSAEAKARETLVMWLRRLAGVSRESFRVATGYDYHDLSGETIGQLCAMGMLEESNGTLRLTEEGLFVSNSVFAELV